MKLATLQGHHLGHPLVTTEQRLAAIARIGKIGDWTHNFITGETFWSDFIYEFFELHKDFDSSSLLHATDFYTDSQRQQLKSLFAVTKYSKKQSHGEFMIVMQDKRVKWHSVSIVPLLDTEGNCYGIHGVLQDITNEKHAEKQDRKERQFYNYIFEKIPTQLVVLNKKGRYIYVNQQAIRNEEYRKRIIGMTNKEYGEYRNWDPAIGAHRDKLLHECIQQRKPVFFEESMFDPQGLEKHYIRTLHPLLDERGETEYVVGYGVDITELRNVKDISFKQQLAIENAMDGIALLDRNGMYYYMNKSHAAIFGYDSPEELIGKDWRVLYPDFEIKRLEKEFIPALRETGFWSGETLGKNKNGETVYQEISLTSLSNAEILCICRDISSRKLNELQMTRLALVAEKTNSIVVITDPMRRIEWVNESFSKILGYTPDEAKGKEPSILYGAETSMETVEYIRAQLEKRGVFSGELLHYNKRGEKFWLYTNITSVLDRSGKLVNYIAVQNDITPFKMVEKRLKKAFDKERELNRFKSQFINLASHQFRTPLASIRSSLDLLELKSDTADFERFRKDFEKHKQSMAVETVRMTEIMENILDIGRMDEGKIEISRKTVCFRKFMAEFIANNQESQGEQRELVYTFTADDSEVQLDEILIRNVLRNIVSNAFKYSEGCQSPELSVSKDKNYYIITVKDYGIGIPKDDQQFLYQSFYRASNAKAFPGTGLGLMIAKRLLELHKGTIHIQSDSGKGCIVTIKIPTL